MHAYFIVSNRRLLFVCTQRERESRLPSHGFPLYLLRIGFENTIRCVCGTIFSTSNTLFHIILYSAIYFIVYHWNCGERCIACDNRANLPPHPLDCVFVCEKTAQVVLMMIACEIYYNGVETALSVGRGHVREKVRKGYPCRLYAQIEIKFHTHRIPNIVGGKVST